MKIRIVIVILLWCVVLSFRSETRLWKSRFISRLSMAKKNKKHVKGFSDDLLKQMQRTLAAEEPQKSDNDTVNDIQLKSESSNIGEVSTVQPTSKYAAKQQAKQNKKNKKNKEVSTDDDGDEDEYEDMEDDTKENEVKDVGKTPEPAKKKGFKNIKFSGNNKLDHVHMGLKHVKMSFGDKDILKDATFSVSTGEKVGLVGPNGAGKSLQLHLLNGDLEPDDGEVVYSSSYIKPAYLHQEFSESLYSNYTVKEELWRAYPEEGELMRNLRKVEARIANHNPNNSESLSDLQVEQQALHKLAVSKKCFHLEGKIFKVLDSTGFSAQDANKLVGDFSGGWKMRIGIAKIFLEDPNILLLDEPTNHLDLDAMIWLEGFLVKQTMPMVIVSHDREFLNNVCNKIVDVENGVTKTYRGNYANYLEQKKNDMTAWVNNYAKQCVEVNTIQNFIKKNKEFPHMAQVVANKEAQLKRMLNSESWLQPPPKQKRYRFKFPPAPRSDELLLEATNIGKQFDNAPPLFEHVDLQIERGSRIGLVGPNGSGKTTLAKIVANIEAPTSGKITFSDHKLRVNYYAQNQADALDPHQTVLETMQEATLYTDDYDITSLRSMLSQFMFKDSDVEKKIEVLSGGEKARVALCKMLVTPANLLIFDEPTNHLDIHSKEALEDALMYYTGGLLVISHDRYFMSKVATSIYTFDGSKVVQHNCDYYDYLNNGEIVPPTLKTTIETRKVEGDFQKISAAVPIVPEKEFVKKKKFGGSGVKNNDPFKGIKNAKRFRNDIK